MQAQHAWSTILLVEDDEDDRFLFEQAFAEVATTNRLVMAGDGDSLMDILARTVPPPPYVIFLDLNMPKKTGFQCLTEIRNHQAYKDIPVVILSTSTNALHIDQVYIDGANYYIFKPSSFSQLKAAIARVLSIDWAKGRPKASREEFVIAS